MIVDCCAQQRTYERFYGLLAERFCRLRLEFQQAFQRIARDTYNTIHRFDPKKIRIMAELVAHLLSTDAIDWAVSVHTDGNTHSVGLLNSLLQVISDIKMTEDGTSSAGRIYTKIVFQQLAEIMGLKKVYDRLNDP